MSSFEKDLVNYISKTFKRNSSQLNVPFESDSEIIPLLKGNYAFNIDDYSFEEDYFSDLNPKILGYNLVIATISDLLATGADPQFFLHSITYDRRRNLEYNKKFLDGINLALNETNTSLLGGDTSTSDNWKYTGVAFGKTNKPLMRSGAGHDDVIYSTGKFGKGNRQALLLHLLQEKKITLNEEIVDLTTPKFISRYSESNIIRKFASFAIDTSDGYINAFKTLKESNENIGFKISINKEIIEEESLSISKLHSLPKELFLFSTLGEYELIFGIPQIKEEDFLKSSKEFNFIKIGEVIKENNIIIERDCKFAPLADDLPDPRTLAVKEYIKSLMKLISELYI